MALSPQKAAYNFKIPGIFPVLVICCLGFLIYSNSFNIPFHFDDGPSIVDNPAIRPAAGVKAVWDFWPTRFMTYLSIALNYHIGKLNVFGYHLFNLAVHLATAVLVWYLTLLTFATPVMKREKISRHAAPAALFAALIFLSHPLQTQGVVYIIQRAASLASLLYIASLCLYAKSRLAEDRSPGAPNSYYFLSLATAIMAMFTKEITISLPAMVLLYEICFFKTNKGICWKRVAPFAIIILIIPVVMLITGSVDIAGMRRSVEEGPSVSPGHYLLTQFRVVVTYLRLLLIPINQHLDYDYPAAKSVFELPVLFSMIFLAVLLAIAKRMFRRYRMLSFAVLWFFLAIFPESSFIPIRDVIFEHRCYLPMAGFGIFAACGVYYFLENKDRERLAAIVLLGLVSIYSILTYNRNLVWKDEISLWGESVRQSPDKLRVYDNRGLAYAKRGDFDRAISDHNKAIEINPRFWRAYVNRGLAYAGKGDLERAISDYDRAIGIDPWNEGVYINRGSAYAKRGDLDRSISDYNKAIEISRSPLEKAKAYDNRGTAYYKKEKPDQAISDYAMAIRLDPDYAEAYNHRGLMYEMKRMPGEAISDYTRAIRIDPGYEEAYNNRGGAYGAKGDIGRAISDFSKAIQLNPDNAQAYYNRAVARFNKGMYDESREDLQRIRASDIKIDPVLLERLKNKTGRHP